MVFPHNYNGTWAIFILCTFFLIYYCLAVKLLFVLNKHFPLIAGFDKTFFINKKSRAVGEGFVLFFIIAAALLVYFSIISAIIPIFKDKTYASNLLFFQNINRNNIILIASITLLWITLVPVFEEIFFRGFFQDRLSLVFNPKYALIVQALCFSLWHQREIIGLLPPLLMGFILGWWRYKNRTLLPIITAHILWNLLAFCLF